MFGFGRRAKAVRENPELMHERKMIAERSFERTDRKAMAVCAVVGTIIAAAGIGFDRNGQAGLATGCICASLAVLLAMWWVNRSDRFKVRIRYGKIAHDDE